MSGWGCPHEVRSFCQRLKKKCDPGVPGCVLYGLVERADVPMPARGGRQRKASPERPESTPEEGENRLQD